MPGVPLMTKKVTSFKTYTIKNCLVFSGCDEEQTSADAYFDHANGAFTYYDLVSYSKLSTYTDEIKMLHTYLPGKGFDQNPTLDGDSDLLNDLVF
jgi:hypothetical protein